MRNNELSQNVSTATRPLLRQIENLQASHSSQIELLENAERNLIERLSKFFSYFFLFKAFIDCINKCLNQRNHKPTVQI
jgi:hypothetical protein